MRYYFRVTTPRHNTEFIEVQAPNKTTAYQNVRQLLRQRYATPRLNGFHITLIPPRYAYTERRVF